jgi:hypothetical protein
VINKHGYDGLGKNTDLSNALEIAECRYITHIDKSKPDEIAVTINKREVTKLDNKVSVSIKEKEKN